MAKRRSAEDIDSLVKDGIPHPRDENSVHDEESDNESIGRGTKRKSSLLPAQSSPSPSPPKQTKISRKDPLVTVGHVFQQGKKSVVIPQDVSHSTPQIFQKEGFVTIEKATKKPKGKGFSKGNNGEETVVVHKSRPKRNTKRPKKYDEMVTYFETQAAEETDSDANDPTYESTKCSKTEKPKKKTTSKFGRQTRDAKRKANER